MGPVDQPVGNTDRRVGEISIKLKASPEAVASGEAFFANVRALGRCGIHYLSCPELLPSNDLKVQVKRV